MNFIILLVFIYRSKNPTIVPCGKPCRQACAQQVDDQAERNARQNTRAEQYRHAQVELAGSTGVLIIGEQPRTHAVHGQIAEHQPHRSANQSQYEVFIQDLPYEYAARLRMPYARPVR